MIGKRKRDNPSALEPIFIIGSQRSGTSIIQSALCAGAGFPGYREGHLSPLLAGMMSQVELCYERVESTAGRGDEIMIHNLSRTEVEDDLLHWFGKTFLRFVERGRWVDKTPGEEGILAAPHLLRIFPKARFVFCFRRGIENLISRMRKFPQIDFQGHCQCWAQCARAWGQVRDQLGDQGLVVMQHECSLSPAKVAEQLRVGLKLTAVQAEAVQRILSSRREEQTGFVTDHRFIGLDETGWTDAQKQYFRQECGEFMGLAGFSMEGTQHAKAPPLQLFWSEREEAVRTSGASREAFRMAGPGHLTLEAPGDGQPFRVRYLHVPLDGHREFHTRVQASESAQLSFSIFDRDGNLLLQDQRDLNPKAELSWQVEFDQELHGWHQIEISARSTGPLRRRPITTQWMSASISKTTPTLAQ